MAKDKTATSLPTCAGGCKREIGAEAGIIPFHVDDSTSTSGEKAQHEGFCPPCFVYVRAPREPERFLAGTFVPIKCASCGKESVAVGRETCPQCNSRSTLVLPPIRGVV